MNATIELIVKVTALLAVFLGSVLGGLLGKDADTAVVLLIGNVIGGIVASLPSTINKMKE